jgi:2-oxoglutarate ferredoxin oxidoreductase subunit gamma
MVPANKIAQELGNERASNMVMLGVLLGNVPILPKGALEGALDAHTADRLKRFIPSNIKALEAGYQYKIA